MVEMGRLYLGFDYPWWMKDSSWLISNLYLYWKRYFKISYSFSRGYRSITRFVKWRSRKIFCFKRGFFFVKLLGITFFRLFIKIVPPRYNITHLSTSQVQNTFHLHFLFENIDTIPKLHGLSTVLDRGHGYSNSFNSAELCTLPTTNSVTAGSHSRIVRRQYMTVSRLIKIFHYVNASTK